MHDWYALEEENKLNNELYGKIEMMKFHDVRKYAFIAMNLYKNLPMQSRFYYITMEFLFFISFWYFGLLEVIEKKLAFLKVDFSVNSD